MRLWVFVLLLSMDIDRATKSELLRMTSTKWRGLNTRHRWEYMCELYDAGASWAAMGRAIDRHASTAKKLWKRGQLERRKKDGGQGWIRTSSLTLQRRLH
jgi:hypothetical protein